MNRTAAPPSLTGVPASRDVMTPATTVQIIPYHSIPRRRLVESTELGLTSAGVLPSALRLRAGLDITVTGCIALTDIARARLPAGLGGSAGLDFGTGASLTGDPPSPRFPP